MPKEGICNFGYPKAPMPYAWPNFALSLPIPGFCAKLLTAFLKKKSGKLEIICLMIKNFPLWKKFFPA